MMSYVILPRIGHKSTHTRMFADIQVPNLTKLLEVQIRLNNLQNKSKTINNILPVSLRSFRILHFFLIF